MRVADRAGCLRIAAEPHGETLGGRSGVARTKPVAVAIAVRQCVALGLGLILNSAGAIAKAIHPPPVDAAWTLAGAWLQSSDAQSPNMPDMAAPSEHMMPPHW